MYVVCMRGMFFLPLTTYAPSSVGSYFFLFVIVLMVIYTLRAKAEKESHYWLNEEKHVDEKPKIKMQELACCYTTFYDSTDPSLGSSVSS